MAERARGLPLPYLKAWRTKRFLGQGELADLTGLSRATIARAEEGDKAVNLANIRKIAAALGVTPEELLEKDPGSEGA